MTVEQNAYFTLLRQGLWNRHEQSKIEWNKVDFEGVLECSLRNKTLVQVYQGLSILLEHLDESSETYQKLVSVKYKWIPTCTYHLHRNKDIMEVQDKVVTMLEQNQVDYCVIKGASVGVFYQEPMNRQAGDIDIYVHPDQFVRACSLFQQSGYQEEGTYSEYHTAFIMNGIEIEVHNSFAGLPVGKTRNSVYFLKDSCSRGEVYSINNHQFKVPSVIDNAVIQILHDIHHLVENGMSIRQICDWMMFVNSCVDDEVWDYKLKEVCEAAHCDEFAKVLTKACALYLGLDNRKITWYQDAKESTVEALLKFVLEERIEKTGGMKRDGLARNLWDYQREEKVNYNLRIISRTIFLLANRKKSMKDVCKRYEQVELLRRRLVECGGFTYKNSKDYAMQ